MRLFSKYLLCVALFSVLMLPSFSFSEENLSEVCDIKNIEKIEQNSTKDEYSVLLEKCRDYFEAEIAVIDKDVSKTEKEKKTLKNEIYLLNKKVKSLNYQISQNNIMVKDLKNQVNDTVNSIERTTIEIEDTRIGLAEILREIDKEDKRSVIELLLAEEKISDFYNNLAALEVLNSEIKNEVKNIKDLKFYLENQKDSLSNEKEEIENAIIAQKFKKNENANAKKDQEYFLSITEKEYEKYIAEKKEAEKKVSEIKARIFELVGVSKAPTFGEALEIAKYVEKITGVRPELLLAVITQESNLGKNVGQCYLRNEKTGAGIVIKTEKTISRVMKPMGKSGRKGDIEDFLIITKELGRDTFNTPVSCPMSYGYGGAMGPAQFIPTTWVNYKGKVKEVTGKPADPWDIKDAFLASAFYLGDYGAKKQTYNKEFNAVLSYFAGPSWYNSKYKDRYKRDYGYPVMKIVGRYEKDIKAIEKNN
ncbi:MAG: lytic murein transglycosylase [Patescibacteria group bacterium]|nr:lytic murein transglycosylase [Patescibacteria group bacterium]